MNPILIVLPILTILMFDLGLTLTLNDFRTFIKRPAPVIAGLAGQLLLLPLIAFTLCLLFRPDPVIFIGIMLIACSPGGSSSNIFSRIAGGDVALSVSLTAFSSIITVFSIPLLIRLSTEYAGFTPEVSLDIPTGKLLMQNIVLMLLPILAGIAIRQWKPLWAAKTDRILSKAAFPSLMLLAAIFFIQHHQVIVRNIGQTGLMLLALILLAMMAGDLLARSLRLNVRERRTILIEVGMQNAAQSIALASSPFAFGNADMAVPAIVYALIMNIVLLSYIAICRKHK